MLNIDINKALDVHKIQIRKRREELFKDLDVQFMKALEQGNSTLAAEIGSKKQKLRDVTNLDISNINTLDELKNLWNTELLGENPYK